MNTDITTQTLTLVFRMSTVLTITHVGISLVAIFTGFVVLAGLLRARQLKTWTEVFLWTTVATSVTGFFFPIEKITPGIIIGILSLLILAVTFYALYSRRLAGPWRKVYVITALIALYFNVFVGVVQSFRHFPPLHALAPTQTEPPFAITQGIVLLIFIVLGITAAIRFREITKIKPD